LPVLALLAPTNTITASANVAMIQLTHANASAELSWLQWAKSGMEVQSSPPPRLEVMAAAPASLKMSGAVANGIVKVQHEGRGGEERVVAVLEKARETQSQHNSRKQHRSRFDGPEEPCEEEPEAMRCNGE
jgi:hypothetical protein